MEPPVTVTLTCRRCADTATLTFAYAVVDPKPADVDPAWDGISLSQVVRCAKCGAEDDYDLRPEDRRRLVAEAGRNPAADAQKTGGARRARAVLRDGTVVKRPSQAIAHAREVAAMHPESATDQCRYGNVCNLYGLAEEAERVWRRGVAMSDQEVESAYNLAANLWYAERWEEAFPFLHLTLQRYPRAELRPGLREEIGEQLARIFEETTEVVREPVALQLAIEGGVVGDQMNVIVSSVDLRRVRDWDRLAEILGSGKVMMCALTPELPDPADGPTNLERMLGGQARRTAQGVAVRKQAARWTPGRSSLSKKGGKKPRGR